MKKEGLPPIGYGRRAEERRHLSLSTFPIEKAFAEGRGTSGPDCPFPALPSSAQMKGTWP